MRSILPKLSENDGDREKEVEKHIDKSGQIEACRCQRNYSKLFISEIKAKKKIIQLKPGHFLLSPAKLVLSLIITFFSLIRLLFMAPVVHVHGCKFFS